ncbi:hypothetical protein_gp179 [Bacillus phage vB_BceM_WH1]|nr:hypothetical protein_gp179 [Bacillus phage vB_BceM_WH1]
MEVFPIGTHVQIKETSEYHHQQFMTWNSGEQLRGVVVENEFNGEGQPDYIYKVSWLYGEGYHHSSNFYRQEDLELGKNISQVDKFKKDADLLID